MATNPAHVATEACCSACGSMAKAKEAAPSDACSLDKGFRERTEILARTSLLTAKATASATAVINQPFGRVTPSSKQKTA